PHELDRAGPARRAQSPGATHDRGRRPPDAAARARGGGPVAPGRPRPRGVARGRRARRAVAVSTSPRLPALKRLGPYEIQGQLGAGGMGEVWLGRDTRLEREVALKVLPARLTA